MVIAGFEAGGRSQELRNAFQKLLKERNEFNINGFRKKFSPVNSILTSDFQQHKVTNLCCFKPSCGNFLYRQYETKRILYFIVLSKMI